MLKWTSKTELPSDIEEFVTEYGRDPLEGDASPSSDLDSQVTAVALRTVSGELQDVMRSALYLAANALEQSHTLSQAIHTPLGSYLHGVMHRRENDFSNAKYWFHRAGAIDMSAQVMSNLDATNHTEIAKLLADSSWAFDPVLLTDLHQQAISRKLSPDSIAAISHLSWLEWFGIVSLIVDRSSQAK